MKILKLTFAILLLVLAACQNHDIKTTNGLTLITGSQGAIGPTIPADAEGALYAMRNIRVTNSTMGYDTTVSGLGFGWFISAKNGKDAGSVLVNANLLSYTGVGAAWYETPGNAPLIYPGDTVVWNVQGNATIGIPAFSYTDSVPFPVVSGLTLPYPVIMGSQVTVHFAITGAYDAIFYSISGSSGGMAFTGNQTTSATFTAEQLSAVTVNGGQLLIQIMPAKLTSYSTAGKTFYFVKDGAYAVATKVQ